MLIRILKEVLANPSDWKLLGPHLERLLTDKLAATPNFVTYMLANECICAYLT